MVLNCLVWTDRFLWWFSTDGFGLTGLEGWCYGDGELKVHDSLVENSVANNYEIIYLVRFLVTAWRAVCPSSDSDTMRNRTQSYDPVMGESLHPCTWYCFAMLLIVAPPLKFYHLSLRIVRFCLWPPLEIAFQLPPTLIVCRVHIWERRAPPWCLFVFVDQAW